jgi:hypothetical protein
MTEQNQEDNTVVSLDEFRKRHPVPSGKLLKDPYKKNSQKRITQDSKSQPVQRRDPNRSRNSKLDEAMRKYGHLGGSAALERSKKKKTDEVLPEV